MVADEGGPPKEVVVVCCPPKEAVAVCCPPKEGMADDGIPKKIEDEGGYAEMSCCKGTWINNCALNRRPRAGGPNCKATDFPLAMASLRSEVVSC